MTQRPGAQPKLNAMVVCLAFFPPAAPPPPGNAFMALASGAKFPEWLLPYTELSNTGLRVLKMNEVPIKDSLSHAPNAPQLMVMLERIGPNAEKVEALTVERWTEAAANVLARFKLDLKQDPLAIMACEALLMKLRGERIIRPA